MQLIDKRNYPLRYIIVAFLILVLFVSVFFLYLKNNKLNNLRANINALVKFQQDFSKVDSCIYILYQAENNSRLYAVTADKRYISGFSSQIQQVSTFLTDLNVGSDDQRKEQFEGLILQKRLQTERYLKLRRLTDSLVIEFSKLGLTKTAAIGKINLNKINSSFKSTTVYDTIKHQPAPGKKFFGRLAAAFSAKKRLTDTSVTIVKTETNNLQNSEVRRFNNRLLKEIDDYYRNLYSSSNKLKEGEMAALTINTKLINEIISILEDYKKDQTQYIAKNKAMMYGELNTQIKQLSSVELLNILLLTCLVGVILYNLYRLYKKEKLLVLLNKKSAKESHSKSRFLSSMSHEIRTPLNSVVGFSEQLANSQLTPEQAEQVGAIRNSSEMLLELVNEILDFSKFEVGKISLEALPFKLEDEITEVFNSMNVLANNKNIELEKKIAFDKDLILMGDRLRLKQVIMNLLTNAIKFTMDGRVTLKAQFVVDGKKHGVLKLQIEDTGIGMAEEDMDAIFDEFSQISSSAKMQKQGTGLGLAICKKIVELQGGRISASSIQGKGSVFSIEIPYELVAEVEQILIEKEKVSATGKLSGKRVLLVDDNKMNILLAQTILKKWKMIYDSAFDGKEALELFKRKQYDIVLTDIQMPVMGGVELTHEIRYNGNFAKSSVPILGITAHVLQENRESYLEAGMNALVLKPFLEQELIDQITKYV